MSSHTAVVTTVRPDGSSLPVKLPTRATVGRAKLSGKTAKAEGADFFSFRSFRSTRGDMAGAAAAAAGDI